MQFFIFIKVSTKVITWLYIRQIMATRKKQHIILLNTSDLMKPLLDVLTHTRARARFLPTSLSVCLSVYLQISLSLSFFVYAYYKRKQLSNMKIHHRHLAVSHAYKLSLCNLHISTLKVHLIVWTFVTHTGICSLPNWRR